MAEAGGDDDRRGDAGVGRVGDDRGYDLGRNGDHRDIRRLRQVPERGDDRSALDLGVAWVDEMERTWKAGALEVGEDGIAKRAGSRAGAHQGDGARRKQAVEAVDGHRGQGLAS